MMSIPEFLPLTPFERYMIADTQPGFPMEMNVQLRFGGRLDANLLADSMPTALARHPLLTARLTGQGRRRRWQFVERHIAEVLEIAPRDADFLAERKPHFDLETGPGLRARVQVGDNESTIMVAAHHAVSDGVGAFEFLSDWFATYQARHDGLSQPVLPVLAPGSLAARGNPRWALAEPITRWQAIRGTFREASRWLFRRPVPLHGTRQPGLLEPPLPGLQFASLTAEETRALRAYASGKRATLNDVLLRDLFVTLAHWQELMAGTRPHRWLRINVPTNLRFPDEAPTPACNIVGFAFLTHRIAETRDQERLLSDLVNEMTAIRRWNLGQLFLDGLARVEAIPAALRCLTRSGWCWSTTVLSNLGDVRRFFQRSLRRVGREYLLGDARLLQVAAAPPVRPNTHAVFLASICRDELTLTVRGHPDRITADEQKRLLDAYVGELRKRASHVLRTTTS